jgi:hypothetical protein
MTVVEHVYHQVSGERPVEAPTRGYDRALQSDGGSFLRSLIADETWRPLNLEWVPEPGLLCIYNREGSNLPTLPSEEEKADIARRVLEVSYSVDGELGWEIPPGESMRGIPTKAKELMVRSRHEVIRYTVFAIPR